MPAAAVTTAKAHDMTSGNLVGPTSRAAHSPGLGGGQPANLGDILERVLDKGLVIAGDIRVNLLDIELLTIKLRLVIASLETAKQVGINWWESDPWLNAQAAERDRSRNGELEEENRQLRRRLRELEAGEHDGG
jgi:Gas vesicle protein